MSQGLTIPRLCIKGLPGGATGVNEDVGASARPRTVTMRVSSGGDKILPRKSRRALLPGSRSRRSLPAGGGSSDAGGGGRSNIESACVWRE